MSLIQDPRWRYLLSPGVGSLLLVLFYALLMFPEVSAETVRWRAFLNTIFSCVGLWLVALLTWYWAHSLALARERQQAQAVAYLELLLKVMGRAAQGDLTVSIIEINSEEPLVKVFEQMLISLRDVVGNLQRLGVALKGASTLLTASTAEHKVVIIEQVATTTQLAATMTEISATSQDLDAALAGVSSSATSTATYAVDSQKKLEEVLISLAATEAASQHVAGQLAGMEEFTSRVGQVSEFIVKLAAQANLLSLNAAIEAERAGAAGRGFSVVAAEIRRLADFTATSAFEIDNSLDFARTSSASTISMVSDFLRQVKEDAARVTEVGEQVAQILRQVQVMSQQLATFQYCTELQASGARAAQEGLQQFNETVRHTLTSVSEAADTAKRLEAISATIYATASHFTVPPPDLPVAGGLPNDSI